MTTESKIIKNRNISIHDFFTNLQLEWLSYKVRSLLYTRPYDKEQFTEFCERKEKTIKGVGLKNKLPTIFDSGTQKIKYLTLFFNANKTFPLFRYRDEYQKKIKGYWDKFYYYNTDTDLFTYSLTGEVCKIIIFDIEKNEATIEANNTIFDVNLLELVRIFNIEILDKIFI